MKERFPDKAWVDVFSKGDLVAPVLAEGAALRPSLLGGQSWGLGGCLPAPLRPSLLNGMRHE